MADKVIEFFVDLQDGNREYNVGDTFPADGVEVSDERLEELRSSDNKRKRPVIKSDEDGLVDKTVVELKDIADEKGIEYDSKIKKAELIALLEK